ncbi:transposase [Bradyrhizobium sp. USDA 4369]
MDENGLPLRIVLSAGQAQTKPPSRPRWKDDLLPAPLLPIAATTSKPLSNWSASTAGQAHIPSQRDRKVQRSVDPRLYRQRNLIERFFCKLKHFRRVATRFDKPARNFLAAVLLASTRIWLRAYESTT